MSRADRLTPFQREVLQAFFSHEQGFFLTGGAALAGFHLQHRTTHDLDLFTTADQLDSGDHALGQVARELGASLEHVRTAPGFRRRLMTRGSESVVVDLVHDRAPQGFAQKLNVGGVQIDPAEEILANKLCTLLSRAEIRDLVDVRALELEGLPLEDALRLAARKDGGLTPAQLAWVLSDLEIGEDAVLPDGLTVEQLREFLLDLQQRLSAMAWPE